MKALTQIHQLPAAMSCLLRCEGLLHPGLAAFVSLECFRLFLCSGIPHVKRVRHRLLSGSDIADFIFDRMWRSLCHEEGCPDSGVPMGGPVGAQVGCSITTSAQEIKMSLKSDTTDDQIPAHITLKADAQKPFGFFPRKFPCRSVRVGAVWLLFLWALSCASVLVFPQVF